MCQLCKVFKIVYQNLLENLDSWFEDLDNPSTLENVQYFHIQSQYLQRQLKYWQNYHNLYLWLD